METYPKTSPGDSLISTLKHLSAMSWFAVVTGYTFILASNTFFQVLIRGETYTTAVARKLQKEHC